MVSGKHRKNRKDLNRVGVDKWERSPHKSLSSELGLESTQFKLCRGGGGGGCNPKNRKKPVQNFKFAVFCQFFRHFSVFCGTFSVFYGLNFDKKFQPFKNHVNYEVLILGGQELPNNILST